MTDLVKLTRGLALVVAWWVVWLSFLPYEPPQGAADPFDASRAIGWTQHLLVFFALGALIGTSGARSRHGLLWIISGCVALELLQLVIPGRHPDGWDLAFNTLGAALGWWSSHRLRAALATAVEGRVRSVWRALFFAGSIVVVFTTAMAQRGFDLATWDGSYALVVGDEPSRDRPWRGRLDGVTLFASAIDGPAARALAAEAFDSESGESLRTELGAAARYAFDAEQREIGSGRVLLAAGDAAELRRDLTTTPAFSVELRCAVDDLTQFGPARIVTFSHDPYLRNFTFGQIEDGGVELRVRCGVSGENGLRYSGVWSEVFEAGRATHLLVSFDRGRMLLYVDGEPLGDAQSMFEARAALHVATGGGGLPIALLWFLPLGFAIASGWPQLRRTRRLAMATATVIAPTTAAALLLPHAPDHPDLWVAVAYGALAMVAGDAIGRWLSRSESTDPVL